ncbi:MAG: ABC transporter ATP-binding protein [Methanomicrobiaceae archaeon]|nr:ABC transporter ATP-binding protein [Methanomicrobiaceae archaeon]
MHTVISTTDLTRTYGDVVAVKSIDLQVAEGELFGLLGPNGSGKSTTVKLLTGQIRPDAGEMSVLGTDVLADPVGVRAKVGIIPEQETPPSFLTAEEYLQFAARIRTLDNGVDERIAYWFDLLEFGETRDQLCKDLSRGTRQKLMVAQAFLHEPRLAIIDEPLINLDPVMQRTIKDFLTDYVRHGNTVFLSTHILSIAEEICSSVGILHRGALRYQGGIDTLREEHSSLEGAFLALVGKPAREA